MNEELKKTNDKLQMQVLKAIVQVVMVSIAMLLIMFGVTYLFNVGGLFIKLLSLAVGAVYVVSGVEGIIKQVKMIKVFSKALKVGKIFESILDRHAESNK